MNKNNTKIMRDTERFLKRTKEYQENRYEGNDENYEIHFVLKKGDKGALTDVIALAACDDMALSFHPYDESNPIYRNERVLNYDDDLFALLEDGYEVVGMSMDSHFCIWISIEEMQDEEIDHPAGMQMYLAYCKRNDISNEKLQEAVSYSGMDAMTLYDGKTKPRIADIRRPDDFNR